MLIDRYGRNGFDYAGDSRADLHVWSAARSGILVNVDRFTRANARKLTSIDRTFTDVRTGWREVIRAMRPHQWTKNLLVFVPLVASGGEVGVSTVSRLLAAFVAFCMVASAIYVLNDLLDLRADRAHPRKRHRPFARGSVLPQTGLVACALLLVAGVTLASVSGVVSVVAIYALLSITYSAKLKELPLVDVFLLAGLYSIRMIGGGVASERPISLWLLAFSSFLFLGLALVKRVSELKGAPAIDDRPVARRGYSAVDLPFLQMFGVGASIASTVVLALFVQDETTSHRYGSPLLLWGAVPLILFWQSRIWLATARGHMHDDPIVYAVRDRVSWLVLTSAALIGLTAKYYLAG